MKIVRIEDVPPVDLTGPLFTGTAARRDLVSPSEGEFNVGVVHFPAGVRNRLHTHTGDQILIVTAGRGWVATESESHQVTVGDVIHIPAGLPHWHGAGDDSDFAHIVITRSGTRTELVDA
ncbi:MAG: cupin domain-containing protein [Thermaerobacter sp.]|nr:cupin domain-containing protein [Bacillota bacterium]REJ37746.1 MAG: cupin domain-containing protein [Bacillota bacterium]